MRVTPGFLLFLTFLCLKLTKVIAWSWFWVTAPLWLGIPAVFIVAFVFLAIGAILEDR